MITSGNASNFQIAQGLHPAVCVLLASIGPQERTSKGQPYTRDEIIVSFEFPLLAWQTPEGESRSKFKSIRENIGLGSMDRPTRFKTFLENWREKEFTPEEIAGFNLSVLLGQPITLEIEHRTNPVTGAVYDDIKRPSRIARWIESDPTQQLVAPLAKSEAFSYDWKNHDETAWLKLPEWIRELTPEWKRRNTGGGNGDEWENQPAQNNAGNGQGETAPANEDEDIPF